MFVIQQQRFLIGWKSVDLTVSYHRILEI